MKTAASFTARATSSGVAMYSETPKCMRTFPIYAAMASSESRRSISEACNTNATKATILGGWWMPLSAH